MNADQFGQTLAATTRRDLDTLSAIEHMVGDIDVRVAAQLALTWLEANAPLWSATLEIAALRAALKVRR